MKIVIVSTAYPLRGGIAQYAGILYKRLKARGHQVHVITFKRQYPKLLFPGQTQMENSKDVSVRIESGGTLVKNKQMRVISTEVFETGHHFAWFPADYEVQKKPGVRCEARLTLKKHKLLGGPFDSDWQ